MKYSIIIPVKKNPRGLEITLNSILRDPELTEHEIIVANDDADPKVSKVVEAFKNDGTPISEVLIKESKGAYYARNRAIEKATGETFIFFDDEMELPIDWFKRLHPVIQEHDYIAGKVVIAKNDNESIFEKYYRLNAFPFEEYFKKYKFGGAGFLVVKKKVFDEVGLFEETLVSGADLEFGQRVHEHDYRSFFFMDYAAVHQSKTLKKQVKTILRDTKGNYNLYLLKPLKFQFFNIKYSSVLKDILTIFPLILRYRENRVYSSGEFSFIPFVILLVFYQFIQAYAKLMVKITPGKKFNY